MNGNRRPTLPNFFAIDFGSRRRTFFYFPACVALMHLSIRIKPFQAFGQQLDLSGCEHASQPGILQRACCNGQREWRLQRRVTANCVTEVSMGRRRKFAGIRVECVSLMVNTSARGVPRIVRLLPRIASRTATPLPMPSGAN
jgi:hypothetical protein